MLALQAKGQRKVLDRSYRLPSADDVNPPTVTILEAKDAVDLIEVMSVKEWYQGKVVRKE
jgi:hypothetical protein